MSYLNLLNNWCYTYTLYLILNYLIVKLILIKTNVENVLCSSILSRIDVNKSIIFFWVNAFYISCFKNWCKIQYLTSVYKPMLRVSHFQHRSIQHQFKTNVKSLIELMLKLYFVVVIHYLALMFSLTKQKQKLTLKGRQK